MSSHGAIALLRVLFLTCGLFAWRAPLAADAPARLKFGWQPGMTCGVEEKITSDGTQVVTSRFDLLVTGTGEGLALRFANYRTVAMTLGNNAKNRMMEENLHRSRVEREFLVDLAGAFMRSESVDQVRQRIGEAEKKHKSGLAALQMAAVRDQPNLDSRYRLDWRSLIGGSIGLSIEPGKTQVVELAPDLKANVMVSAPHPCTDAASARCVDVVTVTVTDRFAPWNRYTLEAEVDSLRPHLWFDEDLMGEAGDKGPEKQRVYRQRLLKFACNSAGT